MVAEDDRNDPALITSRDAGGLGLDGVWADDFHHVVRVSLTGEQESYFGDYTGTAHELCETLTHGWLFRGQPQPRSGKPRGGDPSGLPVERFIYCISNHDQVGNHAYGERLRAVASPAAYRAASALLCFSPYTPLLFMGQEWGTETPFLFFTDHKEDLGRKVTLGRREEFRHFAAFRSENHSRRFRTRNERKRFYSLNCRGMNSAAPTTRRTLRSIPRPSVCVRPFRASVPVLAIHSRLA